MLVVRIIYLICLTGSIVLVSKHGGRLPYAIFYFMLFLPLLSYLYTVYVYAKFKIYQTIDRKTVVKGDKVDYTYIVANEDIVTFQNMKVNFYETESKIDLSKGALEFNLVPGDKIQTTTKLICHYRGEYPIGIKSVQVSDLLGLFTITYPSKAKLIATVLPRVIELDTLSIIPKENDSKFEIRKKSFGQEYLDSETRKYQRGDSKKLIHHKLSARKGELMSRMIGHLPEEEVHIYLNMKETSREGRIIYEDRVLESALAITNYYLKRNIRSYVIYEYIKECKVSIHDKDSFDAFYQSCAKISFHAKSSVFHLYHKDTLKLTAPCFQIIITDKIGIENLEVLKRAGDLGHNIVILLIQDEITKDEENVIKVLIQYGISVKQISKQDLLEESL